MVMKFTVIDGGKTVKRPLPSLPKSQKKLNFSINAVDEKDIEMIIKKALKDIRL